MNFLKFAFEKFEQELDDLAQLQCVNCDWILGEGEGLYYLNLVFIY